MRYIYWFLPIILALCLAGCAKTDSRFDGNWVDVNGENTLEIKGNKLKISYGQWSDSYRYKVRQEYGRTYLSNVKEDGNFGMMTELEFSEEDGSLFAWDMLLDADGHRYCFVRKENLEEERKIQDLSAKLLEAKNISGHNGYYLTDTQSEFSYGIYVKYVSGERLRIRAEGTPAQECIFDLNALLDYASDKVVNEGW
jgi:hypothetical protein